MSDYLCVRVDCYKDGKMVPISFSYNDLDTKFIRKIKRIWQEKGAYSKEITRYLCLLADETTIVLSCQEGRWYV